MQLRGHQLHFPPIVIVEVRDRDAMWPARFTAAFCGWLDFRFFLGTQSSNIALQRVVQSVRHTKRTDLQPLKEGWLIHFTNKNTMKKRHYWQLDSKTITMCQSETGSKFYKELPLSDILSIDPGNAAAPAAHTFQLRTEKLIYYVGENVNSGNALEWARAIKQSLMPVAPNTNTSIPKVILNDTSDITNSANQLSSPGETEDIHVIYQIFPDEVLGSGQFGVVYGGAERRHNGRQVRHHTSIGCHPFISR